MIYIAAQPSDLYFAWQIQVYIHNFYTIGIPKENIHVILSETSNTDVLDLAERNKDLASFFFYPDTREDHYYAPTIRPHLIKKHFDQYPWLEQKQIFYHDADIIFREKIDEKTFSDSYNWHLSNTLDYIGLAHLNSFGSSIISSLCNIVGLPIDEGLENIENFGGAQYVIRGVNYTFWNKHEKDSEAIYNYIKHNKPIFKSLLIDYASNKEVNFEKLQEWCADMWSMVLNGIYFGFNLEINSELDFCWPYQPVNRWHNTKILHNAGVTAQQSEHYFYKSKYINYTPFEDHDLDKYDFTKCTIKYVEAIKSARNCTLKSLYGSYVIFICQENCTKEQIEVQIRYFERYFCDYNLCIYSEEKSEIENIPGDYMFKLRGIQQLLDCVGNNLCIIINPFIIFEHRQFYNAFLDVKSNHFELVIPYDKLIKIDDIYKKELFKRKLNTSYFIDEELEGNDYYLNNFLIVNNITPLTTLGNTNVSILLSNFLTAGLINCKTSKRLKFDYFYAKF
ncbi:hypothetical protein [Sphingobacterium ginsenosidimutans]|uniref:Uncharacterized protein n=1 Tax=Sphingobacterium ginsenosidimutans TaxID=687845 RepID=A0ABP8AEQ5_9SPHI